MLAFTRLTSILLFVLSLGFLTCAAPTSAKSNALAIRGDDPAALCLDALVALNVKVDAHVAACADVRTTAEAVVLVDQVLATVKVTVDIIAKIGPNLSASDDIKLKIAAQLALCIRAIVKICATLVAKLGATVALSLCVQIDACMKILLVTINACVSGVIALCVKLLVDIDVKVFLKLNLDLCVQVLGLVHVTVMAAINAAL